MIIQKSENNIEKSQQFTEASCSVDAEDMRYIASLLRNNYSDTVWATVREIIANAVDAANDSGSGRVDVFAPTNLDPTFRVRDFGNGLSKEDVLGMYSKYGKSTKRNSNQGIGGFGIGRFAPLSYGESFTVISYCDGTKNTYLVRVDEFEDTKITLLSEEKSQEESGIEIQVAVKQVDTRRFVEKISFLYEFGLKFNIYGISSLEPAEVLFEGENFKLINKFFGSDCYISMGGIPYPVDTTFIKNTPWYKNNFRRRTNFDKTFIVDLPIGSVKLHHSRESIEYSDATVSFLNEKFKKATDSLLHSVVEEIKSKDNIVESYRFYLKTKDFNDLPWDKQIAPYSYGPYDNVFGTYYTNSRVKSGYSRGRNTKEVSLSNIVQSDKILFIIDDFSSNKGKLIQRRLKTISEKYNRETLIFHSGNKDSFVETFNQDIFDYLSKNESLVFLSDIDPAPSPTRSTGPISRKRGNVGISGIYSFGGTTWEPAKREDIDSLIGEKKYYVVANGNRLLPYHIYLTVSRFLIKFDEIASYLDIEKDIPLFKVTDSKSKALSENSEWVNLVDLVKNKMDKKSKQLNKVSLNFNPNHSHFFYKISEHASSSAKGEIKKIANKINSALEIKKKSQKFLEIANFLQLTYPELPEQNFSNLRKEAFDFFENNMFFLAYDIYKWQTLNLDTYLKKIDDISSSALNIYYERLAKTVDAVHFAKKRS